MAVSLLLAAGPASAAAAPSVTTTNPAKGGAGWVGHQFKDGSLVGQFGPDAGLTVDGVLALAAAKVGRTTTTTAVDWLETQVGTYAAFTDTQPDPDTTTWYAGGLGKLLLAAAATGRSTSSFGGFNLVTHLQDLECTPARVAAAGCTADQLGEYVDSGPNAFGSVTYQAYALLGLAAAHVTPTQTAVAYLIGQQCTGGGFQNDHRKTGETCTRDTDVTAVVIQALHAVGKAATAGPSADWLASRQNANGSFAGTGPTAVANSNTTALAAQALSLGTAHQAAVTKARRYIRSLQVGCKAKVSDRGAIGYTTAAVTDNTLRASVQAVPALAGATIGSASDDGAAAGLPVLACAGAAPSPPASSSGGGGSTPAPADAGSANSGNILAATGTSPVLVGVGVLFVAVGGLLVVAGRPRRSRG